MSPAAGAGGGPPLEAGTPPGFVNPVSSVVKAASELRPAGVGLVSKPLVGLKSGLGRAGVAATQARKIPLQRAEAAAAVSAAAATAATPIATAVVPAGAVAATAATPTARAAVKATAATTAASTRGTALGVTAGGGVVKVRRARTRTRTPAPSSPTPMHGRHTDGSSPGPGNGGGGGEAKKSGADSATGRVLRRRRSVTAEAAADALMAIANKGADSSNPESASTLYR